MKNILVTGAAGFIGYHMSKRLIEEGYYVIGIDNLNDYYDVSLKQARLDVLSNYDCFTFHKIDIGNKDELSRICRAEEFDAVIHLAAQAGVRYSIEHPMVYGDTNIIGFLNILEMCRAEDIKYLMYASSSSVYGGNDKTPFSESDQVDRPVSLYAATKKSNELMAYTYSHLYNIPTVGVRFFTVYGPFGRPDMAYFKFSNKMMKGDAIDVYNHGLLSRDFTYIDDIVEGLYRLLQKPPKGEVPYEIFNIGYGNPVKLLDFIEILESNFDRVAKKNYVEMQPGDVEVTYADITKLKEYVGYQPQTSFGEGIKSFVNWYKMYYGENQ